MCCAACTLEVVSDEGLGDTMGIRYAPDVVLSDMIKSWNGTDMGAFTYNKNHMYKYTACITKHAHASRDIHEVLARYPK